MFDKLRLRRAYVAHMRGNLEEARERYEAVFAGGFDHAVYHAVYTMLLMNLGELETARDVLIEALDFFETPVPGLSDRQKKRVQKRFTPSNQADLRLNLALAQWKLNDIDAAVKTATKVFTAYKSATVYGTLGFLLIAQSDAHGDYREALAFNTEACAYIEDAAPGGKQSTFAKGEEAVIYDNLGQIYYRMGEKPKAKEHFLRAIEKREKQADTLYFLALIAWEEGDEATAREMIRRLYDREKFPVMATVPKEKMDALRDEISGGITGKNK